MLISRFFSLHESKRPGSSMYEKKQKNTLGFPPPPPPGGDPIGWRPTHPRAPPPSFPPPPPPPPPPRRRQRMPRLRRTAAAGLPRARGGSISPGRGADLRGFVGPMALGRGGGLLRADLGSCNLICSGRTAGPAGWRGGRRGAGTGEVVGEARNSMASDPWLPVVMALDFRCACVRHSSR
ncbi:hypothetical protein BRADI_1g64125v3 [Brachypodium distachyon]|uniref:Uncharacterized protein n=1 Tax=Brachypodium distachyon TaxID=15368 RepID=A0A0Q3LG10_BRADI|nr:hypothetical protein BRADI_1g64125v3 [Brachypodium distachyon]